jgi:hypothetical protein
MNVDTTLSTGPAAPTTDLEVLRELDDLRPACECEGDEGGRAVLRGVALVLAHGMAAPKWLADAYLRRAALVTGAHVGSLDEAFGRPWPLRTRLDIERRRIQNRRLVHAAVWAAVSKSPETPITRHLFDDIAKQLNTGLSGGEVDRLYYGAVADGSLDVAAWKRARKGQQPNPRPSGEGCGLAVALAAVNR